MFVPLSWRCGYGVSFDVIPLISSGLFRNTKWRKFCRGSSS